MNSFPFISLGLALLLLSGSMYYSQPLGGAVEEVAIEKVATLAEVEKEEKSDLEKTATSSKAFYLTENNEILLEKYLIDTLVDGKKPHIVIPTQRTPQVDAKLSEICWKALYYMGATADIFLHSGSQPICEKEIRLQAKKNGLAVKSLQR